ncbi:MAG TPA: ATP-binding protein [Candidatus Eisenbacteria bacterium]|nr:ATP-binding protein [Candidatus Eisenbacteria bacterium]
MTLHSRADGASGSSAGPRAVVVELVGLPGSGKSYLAHQLVLAMQRRNAPVRVADAPVSAAAPRTVRAARKAAHSAREVLRHPRRSGRIVPCIASSQRGGGDALALAVQWLVTQRLLAAARAASGLHLFEEGVLQTLWSIGLRGRLEPVLGMLAGDVQWPDLVVAVEPPLPLVQERLAARQSRHSRVQQLTAGEQAEALRTGNDLLHELLGWWQGPAGPGVPVLAVRNADVSPAPEQLDRLADRLLTAPRW